MPRVNREPVLSNLSGVADAFLSLRVAVMAVGTQGLERAREELDGVAVVAIDVVDDGCFDDTCPIKVALAEGVCPELLLPDRPPSRGLVKAAPRLLAPALIIVPGVALRLGRHLGDTPGVLGPYESSMLRHTSRLQLTSGLG